jgi:uncharacterized protein YecT (DUF1311 family)
MTEPEITGDADSAGRRRAWIIAGIAFAALLLIGLLLTTLGSNGAPEDRLADNPVDGAPPTNPERVCASQAVHDLIKRELFRRAAQAREGDQPAFDTLARYAVARMEAAAATGEDEDAGTISCTGTLWLDLPPGVIAAGGRRTLNADVNYTAQPATEGSPRLVGLGNADAIVTALSSLARVGAADEDPTNSTDPSLVEPLDPLAPIVPPGTQPSQPQDSAEPGTSAGPGPSFDCRFARTSSEIAVCNDSSLAALDRQMASQFEQAMARAGPAERRLLESTRGRFLAYRDGCRTNSCIASAYQGRMREIRDILTGQWRPPR